MDIESLFDRQFNRIYRTARMYLGNVQDAEDAVQAVLLKCIEKQMEFEDVNHENAWFLTVTRNYCKDVLKTTWKKSVDLGEYPDDFEEEESDYGLMEHIMKLSEKYREVLYLYYYEELSIREISKLLKRGESTIQTQLATARKKLKIDLEKGDGYYGRKADQRSI
ncbi:MAG: sigma-70 family RNA polymerase sigma factor [Eubacteriales bacterium]|nr:sigma-70 family RNA polymerase sigma factor [Eubacteriales bacterium]